MTAPFEHRVHKWFTIWTFVAATYGLLHLGAAIVLLAKPTPRAEGAGGLLLLIDSIVILLIGTRRLRHAEPPRRSP